MAKIESYRDYFNPANLAVLRKCNIKYQKAKECWNKEDWKKAIKLYNEFIEINTADASTFIEIGVAYYETKRMRLSQQNLERAKKLKPSNALLNYYLANIYSEKKEWKRAAACLDSINDDSDLEEKIRKLRKKISKEVKNE
jgi:tetratricopeptide (TPR) repeat protein|tara:strand:+ start:162 stop:584 length:423 start_codon:yes stop_codon:yes gene_type:complete